MDYFSAKKPHEVQLLQFDFSGLLRKSETVVWCDFTASDLETGDPVESILKGPGLASKKSVSVKAGGGEDGKLYKVSCNIQTSLGQRLELEGILPVGDAPVAVQDIKAEEVEVLDEKSAHPKIQFKSIPLKDLKTDIIERNGVRIGVITGYASTYDEDLVGDIVVKGAFRNSLNDYRNRNRPIKMLYEHDDDDLIGIFPVQSMYEDEKGLYVEGEVNLEVAKGSDVHALLRQGALADFSIGYIARDYGYDAKGRRLLKEIELVEISVVGRPANPQAVIVGVKKELGEVKEAFSTKREAEKLLRDNGFSRSAATYISSMLKIEEKEEPVKTESKYLTETLKEINELAKHARNQDDFSVVAQLVDYVTTNAESDDNLKALLSGLKGE